MDIQVKKPEMTNIRRAPEFVISASVCDLVALGCRGNPADSRWVVVLPTHECFHELMMDESVSIREMDCTDKAMQARGYDSYTFEDLEALDE